MIKELAEWTGKNDGNTVRMRRHRDTFVVILQNETRCGIGTNADLEVAVGDALMQVGAR